MYSRSKITTSPLASQSPAAAQTCVTREPPPFDDVSFMKSSRLFVEWGLSNQPERGQRQADGEGRVPCRTGLRTWRASRICSAQRTRILFREAAHGGHHSVNAAAGAGFSGDRFDAAGPVVETLARRTVPGI